jgi:carboxyl-terminal processing protease
MRAGDIILAIDGVDTANVSFNETVKKIRGKPGEVVRLTVMHAGEEEPVELEIERAIIPVESVMGDGHREDGSWDFQLEEHPQITYIRLVTFGENSVEELKRALQEAQPQALVLDLRDNAGGLLSAAVGVCDLFIDEGVIVSIRGKGGEVRDCFTATDDMGLNPSVPMAVLVNGLSASASEIVAACLQDHRRAKIVGERTWGKGTVQNVIELEGGEAAIKLTTASYWRPNGQNIHRKEEDDESDQWGVMPDDGFQVKLTVEEANEVRKRRRDRDTVMLGDGSDPGATDQAEQEPVRADPQLQRAVDYLLKTLSGEREQLKSRAA